MNDTELPGIDAPLQAYLEIAEAYYQQDRLDAAMAVVLDAFTRQGWPAGLWTEFYNELVCENDARNASDPYQVDDKLSIELSRAEPMSTRERLRTIALEARAMIGEKLGVEFLRPVIVTVFLPDAAVDFIIGSHGYVPHKTDIDKICLPYDTLESREETMDTLVHEFSHVAVSELARGGPARWLDEGLATYMCGDLSTPRAKSLIRQGVKNASLLGISRLQGVFASSDMYKDDPKEVETAYYLAGSFVAWWAEQKGLASVREALVRIGEGMGERKAIGKAAGMSLWQMDRKWRRFMQLGGRQRE